MVQVFEEQEDRSGSLRYPLSTQRHALDFVKLINRKGFPYVLMCQAINEQQEKFRSWRLGNGHAHIGLAMLKRINSTVQVQRSTNSQAGSKGTRGRSHAPPSQRSKRSVGVRGP